MAGESTKLSNAAHRRINRLCEFRTNEDDIFLKTHLGQPEPDVANWTLAVTGLVECPISLTMDDLLSFPRTELTAFHKCAGSPVLPPQPSPDDVANVVWSGVRLADILAKAKPRPTAAFVWSSGKDFGSYRGAPSQCYCKDLPLDVNRR